MSGTKTDRKRTRNQISTFAALGLFARPPGDPERLPALPRLDDAEAPVAERARAYLHVNCSHCHRPEGTGRGTADLRFTTADQSLGICNMQPLTVDPQRPHARLLIPGKPEDSMILRRMEAESLERMPPVGSKSADPAGLELITDWIDSLTGCE